MKLEIDDDLLDDVIVASLRQSIELIEREIKCLNKVKKRNDRQEADLVDAIVNLHGLKVACAYYGGNVI